MYIYIYTNDISIFLEVIFITKWVPYMPAKGSLGASGGGVLSTGPGPLRDYSEFPTLWFRREFRCGGRHLSSQAHGVGHIFWLMLFIMIRRSFLSRSQGCSVFLNESSSWLSSVLAAISIFIHFQSNFWQNPQTTKLKFYSHPKHASRLFIHFWIITWWRGTKGLDKPSMFGGKLWRIWMIWSYEWMMYHAVSSGWWFGTWI